MSAKRLVASLLGLTVAATLLTAVEPVARATAAVGSAFDAGYIISDETFYNSGAMSRSDLQSFLNEKGSGCTANSLPCLKDIVLNIDPRSGNEYCNAVPAVAGARAADVFFEVARACGINPQVLLVLVEKEQSLVSRSSPSEYSYRYATGFACPDTGGCDTALAGFVTQVYYAAKQFQRYRIDPGYYNFQAGRNNNIPYSPNASCGASSVYIRNQATAGLYNYTPYQPNAAALANLYGTGDGCSSYGNRNFWRMFSDWFSNPANLLSAASFEGSAGPWTFVNGMINRQVAGPTDGARSGAYFLAVHTAVAGRSLAQDVPLAVPAGQTYTASIWVRSGTPGVPYSGELAIWALGGRQELATSKFSVGDAWTEVTTVLTTTQPHHTLRAEVYLQSTDAVMFIDNTSLQAETAQASKAPLVMSSPSFEEGTGTWSNWNGFTNRQIYDFGANAHSGTRVLAANTAVPSRSIGQDIPRAASPGESLIGTIWIRSSSDAPFNGTLALWAVGTGGDVGLTRFSVGPQWTAVEARLTVTRPGTYAVRLEVYLETVGNDVYLDSASVTPNLVQNSSFEAGLDTWNSGLSPNALERLPAAIVGTAVHGGHVAATRTDFSGSVATDVTRRLNVGEVYTATVWVRSGTVGQPWSGELALWALGGEQELALAPFVAGDEWTAVSVQLPLGRIGHTALRLEIYAKSTGVVFLDSVSLN